MARPQNGVNGSIPQQSFGYLTNTYNINNQVQRNHNQNIYGFPEMQQVIPGSYLTQGYPSQHGHNAANNIRPVSPMVPTPQFTYFPYAPPQTNYPQYSYIQNFTPTQQYMYPLDVPTPQVPVNYPTSTRKLNPLVVVDPTNNTDLDLSKYQSQSAIEKKSKELNKNDSLIEDIKIEDFKQTIHVKSEVQYKENEHIDEKTEDVQIESIPSKELLDNVPSNDIIYGNKEVKEESSIEEINDMDKEIESIKLEIDIDSSTQGNIIEDEIGLLVPEKTLPNYFLQINKKESDETILRRKLIYDREYLISLKSQSQSKKKPINLPDTSDFSEEIIYSESQNISCTKPESSPTTQLSNDKYNKKQTSKFQGSGRKYPKMFQPKLINLDTNDYQVLERSKSSYLPPQLRIKDKEIDPYIELKRNIKCNLNKITPQNFQDCLLEINKLNIKEKDEMSCLINEIFNKAVQEEAYSVTYAQFCNKLSAIYSDNHSFKSQLLKKCQDMFQTPIQEQLGSVRTEWLLKIDNEEDSKMKCLYESDLEEQVKKAKDRYFGNIRFIGELFLHHLLAGKVILNCIVELLKGKSDTDALLALCKLMETCGKQIDERNKDQMSGFIRNMEDLSKSKELETRIRFKLKDIVDMRKRDWTLRHIQQEKKINPKTIEEQKEEDAAEAAAKLAASQVLSKKSHHNTQNNPVIRRQISTQQQRPIAVKNLSCSTVLMDEKTVLGPARSNWTAGSGAKPNQKDSEFWTPISQKYTNNSRSPDQSPQVKMKNRYRPLESSAEGSGADSRSSTPPITHAINISKTYPTKKIIELVTDEDRADIIFNDLMLTNKFDVDNWIRIVEVKPIIEKWIDYMMEKDTCCRRSVGDSFAQLIKDKLISQEQLIEGTQLFVSQIDDLIYDIPKLWDFFAEFFERFICDKNSDISFFQSIFKELLPSRNVALCLSRGLHAASSRLGHYIVGQVFQRSQLKWEHIVPNDWSQFVIDNGLQFTTSGGARLSECGGHSLQSITDDLSEMLSEDVPNEGILEYLEQHIDKPTWKSSECTRTITSCILKALKRSPKSNVRKYLNDKSEIIRLFSQNKLDNEVEVLRSVLHVADHLDNESLTIIYDVIMTGKIVSNEAFDKYLADTSFKSESNFDLTYQIISQLWSLGTHHR